MTTKANDTQVGGTHYQTDLQHWDVAAMLDLPYFQGQISKYITRARKKNGRQDAEKALHFWTKWMEVSEPEWRDVNMPKDYSTRFHLRLSPYKMRVYAEVNGLVAAEVHALQVVLDPTSSTQQRADARYLYATWVEHQWPDGSEAGPGYVNQDR